MAGSIHGAMPKNSHSSGSHWQECRFISMVRLALVTSVTNAPPSGPPVRFCQQTDASHVWAPAQGCWTSAAAAAAAAAALWCAGRRGAGQRCGGNGKDPGTLTHNSQVSTVPKRTCCPLSASSREGVGWSNIQRAFKALKYVASGRPQRSCAVAGTPRPPPPSRLAGGAQQVALGSQLRTVGRRAVG